MNLQTYLQGQRSRVDAELERLLPPVEGPAATVAEAVRYAVMGGGKRLRPILALAACDACAGDSDSVLPAVCSLELIHSYSLIHDDLPAMDDDDLRRGRPTTHKVYGEAVAILAGDAAQALAFEWLSVFPEGATVSDRRSRAVQVLAGASGIGGMVGGQMADLEAERSTADLDRLRWIHRHKTGALFAAGTEIGAVLAGAESAACAAMKEYGHRLGLAFQIADDLLDRTGSAEELGKTPGKDEAAGKSTFPSLLGVEASIQAAKTEVLGAKAALDGMGVPEGPLHRIAEYAIERTH